MNRLFFNSKQKEYYLLIDQEDPITCHKCEEEIERLIIVELNWGKRKSLLRYYCVECVPKMKTQPNLTVARERFIATIVNFIPENSYPIIPTPLELKGANETHSGFDNVFDAAQPNFRKNDNPIANDRTIYAGRQPERMDMAKRMEELEETTERLNTQLESKEEARDFLLSLQNAVPVIKGGQKRRIETKSRKKERKERDEKA